MSTESPLIPLPYITAELPGVGGQLKAEPSAFIVEEIPVYDASGEGSHLYVSLTREGWTTRKVVEALASLYGIDRGSVGYAGLKDRHARCTQTFSLPNLQPEDAQRIQDELSFTVNWARCHGNKLKVGHLLGNRFTITVSGLNVDPDTARVRASAIAGAIAGRGVPNFFGAQRFGIEGQNVVRGRAAFLGNGPREKWLNRLLISAYQSHLFNIYLVQRIEQDLFSRLLDGDVCKKANTGGMFEVADPAADSHASIAARSATPGRSLARRCGLQHAQLRFWRIRLWPTQGLARRSCAAAVLMAHAARRACGCRRSM